MDEIRDKRTIIHETPVGGRPVVETQYDRTVQERNPLSGGAIAAMIIGGIILAIVITWLIVKNQQTDELAMERERALIAERNAAQSQAAQQQQPQQQQQPNIVVLPQTQPSTVPVPAPAPAPAEPAPALTSSISIEVDVNRRLLDDTQLGSYPITAKVENGTVTLSGTLPQEDLKTRAEKVASSAKGVRRVINDIIVSAG